MKNGHFQNVQKRISEKSFVKHGKNTLLRERCKNVFLLELFMTNTFFFGFCFLCQKNQEGNFGHKK